MNAVDGQVEMVMGGAFRDVLSAGEALYAGIEQG
jgi:hypothetical protein